MTKYVVSRHMIDMGKRKILSRSAGVRQANTLIRESEQYYIDEWIFEGEIEYRRTNVVTEEQEVAKIVGKKITWVPSGVTDYKIVTM